jgi:hypothetical protein
MAAHLASVASLPVYRSARRPGSSGLDDERIEKVAPATKYLFNDFFSIPEVGVRLMDCTILIVMGALLRTGNRPYASFVHRDVLDTTSDAMPITYTPFTLADVSSTWLTLAWSG